MVQVQKRVLCSKLCRLSVPWCVCPADALVRAGMPCRVLAIINDSVGCLAASCYYDQATEMGVILGTGTNACIVVPVSGWPCLLHAW